MAPTNRAVSGTSGVDDGQRGTRPVLVSVELIERAGWDALCEGRGAEFYGRLMTADGLMVLAHGAVLNRDEVIASLADAPRWSSYSISELREVDQGPGAAALVYRGEARRPGATLTAWMTSCYVRRAGGWRLALYQQTPIP
jgi:hypothetical protein